MHRLSLLKNHLSSPLNPEDTQHLLKKYRSKSTINPNALKQLFFADLLSIHERVFQILSSDPIFNKQNMHEIDRKEHRALVLRQFQTLMKEYGLPSYEDLQKDPLAMMKLSIPISRFDANLRVKMTIHFTLYTQSLMLLGTSKHKRFIDNALSLKDYGSFCLTELGHGTNANGIMTRADYDHKTREFILNTPNKLGMKFWIAGVGQVSDIAVVFAQLYVEGVHQGIHAFIVPIRNKKDHTLLPGVTAGDCGLKVGCNGVDNGFLMLEGVRVPYDNLLDRFGSIDDKGKYQSPIKNSGKRFALTISALNGGRISVVWTGINQLVNALTIATRYAAVRRQFGPPQQAEVSILEYPLTQYRLMPYLAETIGFAFAGHTLRNRWRNVQDILFEETNPSLMELHVIISVMKPVSSWTAQTVAQECRQICGGLGYSGYNGLGTIVSDNDVGLTVEGDNNILLQQSARFLLNCLSQVKEKGKVAFPSVYFLTGDSPNYQTGEVSDFAKDQLGIKKALEVRANKLIHDCAAYLKKDLQNGLSSSDAWNELQPHFGREASKAFADLYVTNEYLLGIERCEDIATKNILKKLFELFGYNKIEKGAAVLLETGYMSRKDLIVVREKIVLLCKEVKDEAIGILDAIATPDTVLGSPIGASDGDVYNRFINAVWTAPEAFEKPYYWREIIEGKRK